MVTCAHCDLDISPRATSCPACGEPGPAAPHPASLTGGLTAVAAGTDGYAIASLACALSPVIGFFVVGSILGIVFGKMARARLAANPSLGGEGLAKAGIILGWAGLALGVLFLLMFLSAFGGFLFL